MARTSTLGPTAFTWVSVALGAGSAIVSGLAPDQRYYVRVYAENVSGYDWTGKLSSPRTQPEAAHLPPGVAMWFDGNDRQR